MDGVQKTGFLIQDLRKFLGLFTKHLNEVSARTDQTAQRQFDKIDDAWQRWRTHSNQMFELLMQNCKEVASDEDLEFLFKFFETMANMAKMHVAAIHPFLEMQRFIQNQRLEAESESFRQFLDNWSQLADKENQLTLKEHKIQQSVRIDMIVIEVDAHKQKLETDKSKHNEQIRHRLAKVEIDHIHVQNRASESEASIKDS